MSMVL